MISAEACREAAEQMAKLNVRERDCVVLAGKGLSDREIGEYIGLRACTVRDYMKRAFRLLEVGGRVEAAVIAAKAGLV